MELRASQSSACDFDLVRNLPHKASTIARLLNAGTPANLEKGILALRFVQRCAITCLWWTMQVVLLVGYHAGGGTGELGGETRGNAARCKGCLAMGQLRYLPQAWSESSVRFERYSTMSHCRSLTTNFSQSSTAPILIRVSSSVRQWPLEACMISIVTAHGRQCLQEKQRGHTASQGLNVTRGLVHSAVVVADGHPSRASLARIARSGRPKIESTQKQPTSCNFPSHARSLGKVYDDFLANEPTICTISLVSICHWCKKSQILEDGG